jgi:hypothetical protein
MMGEAAPGLLCANNHSPGGFVMRRVMAWAAAAVLPALVVSVLVVGCGGDNKTEAPKESKKKTTKTPIKLTELASTGWGTLKGKVTVDGTPDIAGLDTQIKTAIEGSQDKAHCLSAPADEKGQQKWSLGKDKGLGDVFVWLAPPEGHYFKIDTKEKTWKDPVTIDQPFCAFVPHAVALFPSHYNPEKPDDPTPTGQKFIIKNSAPMNHNTAWKGGDANPGDNKSIPSKGDPITIELKPDADPVMLHCDIHKWMDGVIRVFDHPYAAVTDKDGNFEIKHVPTGVELNIFAWHEVGGNAKETGDKGLKAKLEDGDKNTKNFTITAK